MLLRLNGDKGKSFARLHFRPQGLTTELMFFTVRQKPRAATLRGQVA